MKKQLKLTKFGYRGWSFQDISGNKYGKLTAIKPIGKPSYKGAGYKWLFECECGKKVIRLAGNMKKKHRHTCGCESKNLGSGDEAGFNRLFKGYKASAKLRGYKFNLTEKFFRTLIFKNCYFCNSKPQPRFEKFTAHAIKANGVDRLDNKKGYIKNNVVTCCSICNKAKSDLTKKEFMKWVRKIYRFNYGEK